MKMRLLAIASVLLLTVSGLALAVDNADVTVTVTPNVGANITISPGSYSFGTLDLNISSNSAAGSGVCNLISNTGQVGLSLEKTVSSVTPDDGAGNDWTLATSTGAQSAFVFWSCTTVDVDTRPGLADFGSYGNYATSKSSFSTTETTYNVLYDKDDAVELLDPSGGSNPTAALWFRIDMPDSVGNNDTRTITVNVKGIVQ